MLCARSEKRLLIDHRGGIGKYSVETFKVQHGYFSNPWQGGRKSPIRVNIYNNKNLLLAAGVVTHVLADIKTGNAEYERVLGSLEQMDQDAKQLVIFLVKTACIFPPKFGWFVDGAPFQSARLNFRRIFVERTKYT